jgi:general secretion pathway protein H
MARTPTSAPGSSPIIGPRRAPAGFTLVELLLVLMLIAMVSGLVSLALRDGSADRLEREALRLSALLEAGRAEARANGLAVRFELASADARTGGDSDVDFRFVGLPPGALQDGNASAGRWLDREVQARIEGARALRLGPEPLIGAQRIVLSLGPQQRVLATDGLSPFAVADTPAPTP